jgi:archaellin
LAKPQKLCICSAQRLLRGLEPYDIFKVEIKPPIGSALTIERQVPASLAYTYLDLG